MDKNFINPVKGRISGFWGKRIHPVSKKESFHNGVDVAVAEGTPILCPANGKVIMADVLDDNAGGIQLKIQADGFIFGFAHCKSLKVRSTEEVFQGEVVAYSGHTGIGTGPHLHFTVRKGTNPNGITCNPLDYFDFKS